MAKSSVFNDLILDNIVSVMVDTIYLKGADHALISEAVTWAKEEAENDWKFKANSFPQYECKNVQIVNAVVDSFKKQRSDEFLLNGCAPTKLTGVIEDLEELSRLKGDSLTETYKDLFLRYANKIIANSVTRYKKYGENFSGYNIAYAILNFDYITKNYMLNEKGVEVADFAGITDEEFEKQLIYSLKIKTVTDASQAVVDEFITTLHNPIPAVIEEEPIKEETIEELVIEEPVVEEVKEEVVELNVIYSDEEITSELDDESIKNSTNAIALEIEEPIVEETIEETVEEENVIEETTEEVVEEENVIEETTEEVVEIATPVEEETVEVVEEVMEETVEEVQDEVAEEPFNSENELVNNFEEELKNMEEGANVEEKALDVVDSISSSKSTTPKQKFDDITRTYVAVKGHSGKTSKKFSKKVLKALEKNSIKNSSLKKKGLQSDYIEQQQFIDDVRLDCLKIPNNKWQKVEKKVKKGK